MRKRSLFKTMLTGVLICCLCFSGCGADSPDENPANRAVGSGVELSSEPVRSPQPTQTSDPAQTPQPTPGSPEEYARAPMPGQTVPEGRDVVTLGTFGTVKLISPMYKAVDAFNRAQEKYFVKIEIYHNYEKFLMDIARKQGTDLYDLSRGVIPDDLAKKGILEDMTPYFEGSGTVGREDIVDAVWRAGSVDDKLYFLIPGIQCNGIVVEKGYTKEGAWSGRDYLELGKKNPGSMLSERIQEPSGQILTQLREYMGAFMDWEERSCSFDSDEFIALLEDLKSLSSYNYDAVDEHATMAELVRGKIYLTKFVSIRMDGGVYSYREIEDAFGDSYEIAGVPTADGSLKYTMNYDQIYGMNAASGNKEGAWAFLEYLVSEEYQQPKMPNGDDVLLNEMFPVRKDALEKGLQVNVDYVTDPNEKIIRIKNRYSNEFAEGYEGFTEENKQAVLRIIDNSYRTSFDNDYTLLNILFEEAEPFFQGQKSVKDVVKIIQSRVSLYLTE